MEEKLIRLGLLDEEELELDLAALELAGADHPGIDLAPYEEVLNSIASRLADVGAVTGTAAERAACLSTVIRNEFGFIGDTETYDDPDNADMISVVDRRRGLPVALSILYVGAARRVGWTAHALDVPGHVLVLIGDDAAPVVIDPFRGGLVVDARTLASLVEAASDGPRPPVRQVSTMPNRAVLVRLLVNQASRAEQVGKGRRALTLYERMTAFAPDHPEAWWHRARLQLVDDDVPAARASLGSMLETTRDPNIRRMVSDMLAGLTPK